MTKHSRGFTLIELMIVVAIVGIVSAISVPSIVSYLPIWHANSATRDVAATLMAARLKAIQTNQEYRVEFTFGSVDSFKVAKKDKYDSNDNDVTDEWIDDGGSSQATSDVEITTNCSGNRVEFNPNGTSSSCSITISNQATEKKRKISLSSNTGRISVQYLDS